MKSKQLLTAAVAALMAASTGIAVVTNTNVTTVQAAKHHKKHAKKHTKKHHKNNSAEELNKLGNWYLGHAKQLYNANNNQGLFGQGQHDALGSNPQVNINTYTNPQYREGWIITYANGKNMNAAPDQVTGGTALSYGQTSALYQKAVKFIQTTHPQYNPKLDNNNNWTINYQRSLADDNN